MAHLMNHTLQLLNKQISHPVLAEVADVLETGEEKQIVRYLGLLCTHGRKLLY